MKGHAVVVAGVVVLAFCACALPQQPALPPPPPQPEVVDGEAQSVDSGFLLESAAVEDLKVSAESGDRDAAFRLSFHFMSAGDQTEARRWQLIAAENGHPVAQYNLWVELKDKTDCQSKREALAWLEAAADSGEKEAQSALLGYREAVRPCSR